MPSSFISYPHRLLSKRVRYTLLAHSQLCSDAMHHQARARQEILGCFFLLAERPPLFFTYLSQHSFSSLAASLSRIRYRWHIRWVRLTFMAQCPCFPPWCCIKESTRWDEDKRVTSAECLLPLQFTVNPVAVQSCDSCFPSANNHMFEQRFLIHELGLVLQPSALQRYCWTSAFSCARAGVL